MFRVVRFQTGEIKEIVNELKNGKIPCVDVDDADEFNWLVNVLKSSGIYLIEDLPLDKNARDPVKEPEFEFRAGFFTKEVKASEVKKNDILYIDIYFEPFEEPTYAPVGEM